MNRLLKQAFTLIELLVVIAIIGILSGLIVVSMSGVTEKANIAKSQVFSNSLKNSLMLNLVSEWKLDNSANDSWSGGNNGTVNGASSITTGCVQGSCYNFDGNDWITFPYTTNIRPTDKITVSAWANAVNWSAATTMILSCTESGGYNLYINSTGYPEVFINGTYRSPKFYTTAPSNGWHNFVFTYDGRYLKTYLDGAYKDVYDAGAIYPITYSAWNNNFMIGVDAGSSTDPGGAYFNGKIDEIRIYNTNASLSQIKESYYLGLNNLLISGQISGNDYMEKYNSVANK
ncbi:MAG: LamG-like jellyroll fold domain-containing protein [Candidatus Paceibacterota bacterium]|jgi:prepilin-type N-terminal cleavage/methylation domain-containing protein